MAGVVALAPQYYKSFKCAAGSCSDDCCHAMVIKIDEGTYKAYSSFRKCKFRDRLLGNIEVTGEDPFVASISLTEKGNCPFLKCNGLCEIQSARSHDILPYACKTYPRVFCDVGGKLETYMSMGCEAAARQALISTEMMWLCDIQINQDILYKNVLEPGKYTAQEDTLDMFWKLRNISVFILQLRKYQLWLRVVMLGFLIERIDRLMAEGKENEIDKFAEEYIKSIEDISVDKYKDMIPDRHDMKILRIFSFFEFISNTRREKERDSLKDCFDQVKAGLGIISLKQPVREVVDNYTNAKDLHYAPFFKNREYIFENYLVNSVLSTGFPFSYRQEKSIYDNFVRLATRYCMIRSLLIGMAGHYKEDFSQETVIRAISAFSRFFDHDKDIADAVVDSFNHNAETDMATISALVKD